ncbi:DUF1365 domain-containing protein [Pseudaestuariivita atlantica]|uniref:Cyclopropane-fatty-acyl-phospholipid synthase n=1 Tax=Pseudaestuariivita atlantica TaxID=1317121 RepID=A0A0L1JTI8_9RHOB|nr:DUF1365 domain-containing protein [Pseudaestuariivita atlantica]KNG94733.1 cyclopropane-fatty-acyl-phospholipid synthase [Pseudaestuariivita atlantica]
MTRPVDHIAGQTWHGRKGATGNGFRYSIDYVLLDAEAPARAPWPFRRNGRGLVSLHDRDHGGAPGDGRGAVWAREVLAEHQVTGVERIDLLAQPRVLGYVFNPVSFWLARDVGGALIAVIAEVTNTFGDRHSYLCRHADLSPIRPTDRLSAVKLMHVSPFQPIEGGYVFRFDITDERIGVWIDYSHGKGGVYATLTGKRRPLGTAAMLRAMLRRPLGARRVMGLIHWQALKLWWKGARYRARPEAPATEVSS